MEVKLIFTTKVSHLASFWKWDFLELGNGLLGRETMARATKFPLLTPATQTSLSLLRNQTESLLHRLVILWCIIAIGKLDLITGVIFSRFLGERRPTARSEQGVLDTRNEGRQKWCVDGHYFFCTFPIVSVSRCKPALYRLLLAWKTRKISLLCRM